MNTKRSLIAIFLTIAAFGRIAVAQMPLSLLSVDPKTISLGQETSITISGTGFVDATVVQLSNLGTLSGGFVNDSTLTIRVPQSLTVGTYSITAVNPDGESTTLDNALHVIPALTVTRSEPGYITRDQQASITVTGTGFVEETSVELSYFGAINDTFVNDTTLTATLPLSLNVGTYSLSIVNPDGKTVTLANALTVSDPTPTAIPLTVSRSEPQRITNGQTNTLSVLGNGFATDAVVRLVGFGLLETTVVHNGAITALIPATIPSGMYTVEVNDSAGSIVQSPNTLQVVAPVVPTATTQPLPSPTPITIANLPSLGISNFIASPNTITAGQSTTLTFTVQNRGTQTARAISVTLGSGSKFVTSGGLASIAIPDLGPGSVFNTSMTITAIQDVTPGPTTIPLKLSYKDISGESYTGDAELSVSIVSSTNQSQIVIDAYTIDPALAEPGQPVVVRMTISNLGNTLAEQVSLRVAGSESVLLPNGRGDTFVIGDLQSGITFPLQLPLIVSTLAKNGPQLQPILITYFQNGEAKETSASISINVANVSKPQPLLLIASYETGHDELQPGTRFNFDVTFQNAGSADAHSVVVTFGTVQSSDGGGKDPNNPDDGSSTNTTPSNTFAPLGTAGLTYIGDIATGTTAHISQEFIVAGGVNSGIYSLPITIQYQLSDGTSKSESLNLSLVVIAPPRLRINPQNPLPEMVNAGEMVPVTLEIANIGRTRIDLTEARVIANNGDVIEGATIPLDALPVEKDTSLTALIMPQGEGVLEVSITLSYLNDLGQDETIELAYSTEVLQPPPIEPEPIEPEPVEPEPEPEDDWFGRFIMAAVGLGS